MLTSLTTPLIIFAIAAVGGLYMAIRIFQNQTPPWALSIVHALLGAIGLVLLLVNVLNGSKGLVVGALIALAIAAVGGFFTASFHLRGQAHPKGIVIIHAGVAVAGFLLLLGAVLGV